MARCKTFVQYLDGQNAFAQPLKFEDLLIKSFFSFI